MASSPSAKDSTAAARAMSGKNDRKPKKVTEAASRSPALSW